jgi:hypothetical protein
MIVIASEAANRWLAALDKHVSIIKTNMESVCLFS